jgi:hypothetical protein
MKTDSRTACANADERKLWAVVHDLIAHPLMALTNWSRESLWFHDWTSHKAWPRPPQKEPISVNCYSDFLRRPVLITERRQGFWTVTVPGRRQYSFLADDLGEAYIASENEWRKQEEHERRHECIGGNDA